LETRPAVHGPLHELEATDLALDLAIAPAKRNGRQHGIIVATRAMREDSELAADRGVEPRAEVIWLVSVGHHAKFKCELMSTR
jgi:hypothetical protein